MASVKPSKKSSTIVAEATVSAPIEKKAAKASPPAAASKASPSPSPKASTPTPKASKASPPAASEPATKAEAAPKAESVKKTKKTVDAEKVNDSEVINETVKEPVKETASDADSVSSILTLLQKHNQELFKMNKEHATLLSQLYKTIQKERRALEKASSKKSRRKSEPGSGSGKPSGFKLPVAISKDLAEFLGVADGTLVSRTEATSQIFSYIKDNNLSNPENRRQINPDAKLAKILSPLEDKDVASGYTYLNIQHYLKGNYPKTAVAVSGNTSS